MEWTLDQDNLSSNPLLTQDGQKEISSLCNYYGISIPSLTADCCMQAPFWKANTADRFLLEKDFLSIIQACSSLNISTVVLPLVDNGRLETSLQKETLLDFLLLHVELFRRSNVRIAFESDFSPSSLSNFIEDLPVDVFGINYDIGNSASLDFNCAEELTLYGSRIFNVHIKDRMKFGSTVPLGMGNADFPLVFRLLRDVDYSGNFIFQTARAVDSDHLGVLRLYKEQVIAWSN